MNSNNKSNEEYLRECGKYFRKAKNKCYVVGQDLLTQDWSDPLDIYNAALGTIIYSCRAYLIYRNKKNLNDVDLYQHWREVIENLNNESLSKAFDSVLNLEDKALEDAFTKEEAKICLQDAKGIYEGIIDIINPSDRIKIGV